MKHLLIFLVLIVNIFSQTQIRESQIKDQAITRDKLNQDSTGKAVLKRIFAVSPLTLTSTGADTGTGDVTLEFDSTKYLRLDSITATHSYIPKISTDKKIVNSSIIDSANLLDFDSDIRIIRNSSFVSARAGRIYKSAEYGLVYHGVAGSTANITWITPSGTRILENPYGSNNIIMGPTGAVSLGIGVNPSQKLHVAGNIYSTTRVQGGTAQMQTSSSFATFGSSSTSIPIRVNTDADGSGNRGITILINGNVGVNKNNPAKTFDVSGTIRTDSILVSTIADGTPPLQVTSLTKVSNLNVDRLDSLSAEDFSLATHNHNGTYCRFRGISATDPSDPLPGDVYYNSTDTTVYIYADSRWINLIP